MCMSNTGRDITYTVIDRTRFSPPTCDVDLFDGLGELVVSYLLRHVSYLPPRGSVGVESGQPPIHHLHHRLTITVHLYTHTYTLLCNFKLCVKRNKEYTYTHTHITTRPDQKTDTIICKQIYISSKTRQTQLDKLFKSCYCIQLLKGLTLLLHRIMNKTKMGM